MPDGVGTIRHEREKHPEVELLRVEDGDLCGVHGSADFFTDGRNWPALPTQRVAPGDGLDEIDPQEQGSGHKVMQEI